MGDEKAAQKGISDQIRACGLFFVSFIIFGVIPLIYHNFVFHAAMPMYKINPASAITVLRPPCCHPAVVARGEARSGSRKLVHGRFWQSSTSS
jgi:hypothetical protein